MIRKIMMKIRLFFLKRALAKQLGKEFFAQVMIQQKNRRKNEDE